ncbi:MAG: class I SAM-dependent methyltransferase, partial [Cyanobacteriota bacterium]
HLHWGYWADPNQALLTPADFAAAAEALTQRICEAAGLADGQRILDVGCGLGGTLMAINEQFQGVELVGLNIDPRQLAVARAQAVARPGNTIRFVEGDACEMPFPDGSFDRILAVECIFHFPSRTRFFSEARRLLRPAGRLALSDFVNTPALQAFTALDQQRADLRASYGNTTVISGAAYERLGEAAGLGRPTVDDITFHTLPTYRVLSRHPVLLPERVDQRINQLLEWVTRLGLLRYRILSWRPQPSESGAPSLDPPDRTPADSSRAA